MTSLRRTTHMYCTYCLNSYENYDDDRCWNCGKCVTTYNTNEIMLRKTIACRNIDIVCKFSTLYIVINRYKTRFRERYYSPGGKGGFIIKTNLKK